MRLDVTENAAHAAVPHVANWVHWVLFLLKITADATLGLGERGKYGFLYQFDWLSVTDINDGLMAGVVRDDRAVTLFNIQEVNRGHRLFLFQRSLKEVARIAICGEFHRTFRDPRYPREKKTSRN